ncbi:hypothetical protein [Phyllobacterium myrsinacearum]|uniref:Uncharacterized protein n=1 Tax=Phyllobacterium myrsinacearum TaxID=28101 RepID=A0A2S9JCI9_9HYPH|nr:hypothetical protein [Phyllobacterium myrsinacearum]PRD50526.1 hypothetical protein C5750_21500 [Phyllobacterium myrsinacearum]PWV94932.1 hypothetical protein DEV92_102388 [Phyllobacterium myrsinacearum]RZV06957.1 hypothetical protein EV654_1624 [Phyllobacterium myrsinacearum]
MSSPMSSLENAAKYLSPEDKAQFVKIKREMEKAGASRKSIEERLNAFIWDVIESDDDEEEDEDE